jgi:hypothetical protein
MSSAVRGSGKRYVTSFTPSVRSVPPSCPPSGVPVAASLVAASLFAASLFAASLVAASDPPS